MKKPRATLAMLLAAIVMAAASCARHSGEWQRLAQADALMEERPDSALEILSGIDPGNLLGDEERARHALLMSMVLDKNWVDTADFAVLQPAIDYYLDRGTPDEKLRTLYYQGRIFQNRGDIDNAMQCYVKGLSTENVRDSLTLARMLNWQSYLFRELGQYPEYCENSLRASSIFARRRLYESQAVCLMDALDACIVGHSRGLADSLMAEIGALSQASPTIGESFVPYKLSYALEFEQKPEVTECLSDIRVDSASPANLLLTSAYARILTGEAPEALRELSLFEPRLSQEGMDNVMRFHAIASLAYDSLGMSRKALEAYRAYYEMRDSLSSIEIEKKTRFSQERHAFELDMQKRNHERIVYRLLIAGTAAVAALAALIALLVARQGRCRAVEQERQIEALREERDKLSEVVRSTAVPDRLKKLLEERLDLINSFIVKEISASNPRGRDFKAWLKNIMGSQAEFMESNKIAIEETKPRFIMRLRERGLGEDEIAYLCLYAIGLNGKEVGFYLRKPSHKNASGLLREKLGVGVRGLSLSKFIRDLYENS